MEWALAAILGGVALWLLMQQQKAKKRTHEKEAELGRLKQVLFDLEQDLERAAVKARTLEDKNKKMLLLSETVYRDKRALDDQHAALLKEKEGLEAEKKKVDEKVKRLWQQSMAIHSEKEKINLLKLEIEEKHQSIQESIEYAEVIQRSLLPEEEHRNDWFSDSFVLYQPRDVVGGDFYWMHRLEDDSVVLVVADCTGHGVPGGFMSMIGQTLLNELIKEKKITSPDQILHHLNDAVRITLRQDLKDSESRDGMDVAVLRWHQAARLLQVSGANRPVWLVAGGSPEVVELKPAKVAIGGRRTEEEKNFVLHELHPAEGTMIYAFSDGYADQFGGDRGKKFMSGNLQKLLVALADKPAQAQEQALRQAFDAWRGTQQQVDDVLVFGFRAD